MTIITKNWWEKASSQKSKSNHRYKRQHRTKLRAMTKVNLAEVYKELEEDLEDVDDIIL